MNRYLLERLKEYEESDMYPLHMPGHKRQAKAGFAENFPNPFSIDITEIDDFDNLHHPEGILKESMDWAGNIYGADKTYYLVNGSSSGILSAVCGAVSHGGTIIMSRNCHKSAYHGIYLNHLRAEYVYPQFISEFGIQGGLSSKEIENMLISHPEAEAVLVVSPTYDGVVSDIEAIARIVHKRGIPLIVDEAHGAHFPFGKEAGFPISALELGGDIVIQSLHKTLPSLTQTALMHVKAGFVDIKRIERYIHMFQSSSPSYVLMASIDNCVRWMDAVGRKEMENFSGRLEALRKELENMKVLKLFDGVVGQYAVFDIDRSKILVSAKRADITGSELKNWLKSSYHLEMEMCGSDYVTAITSVADTGEGLDRLGKAMMKVDRYVKKGRIDLELSTINRLNVDKSVEKAAKTVDKFVEKELLCGLPIPLMTIAEAMDAPSREVLLGACAGMISAEFIYLYPPGIPIIAPGEVIKPGHVELIRQYKNRGLPVHGMMEGERIKVTAE